MFILFRLTESELLLSYLTVDYVRIPLVVNFFASHDRITYLFNRELQDLLRSVLFEPGTWVLQVFREKEREMERAEIFRLI